MPGKSKIDLELTINLVKQAAHYQRSLSEAVRKVNVHSVFQHMPEETEMIQSMSQKGK